MGIAAGQKGLHHTGGFAGRITLQLIADASAAGLFKASLRLLPKALFGGAQGLAWQAGECASLRYRPGQHLLRSDKIVDQPQLAGALARNEFPVSDNCWLSECPTCKDNR